MQTDALIKKLQGAFAMARAQRKEDLGQGHTELAHFERGYMAALKFAMNEIAKAAAVVDQDTLDALLGQAVRRALIRAFTWRNPEDEFMRRHLPTWVDQAMINLEGNIVEHMPTSYVLVYLHQAIVKRLAAELEGEAARGH